MNRLEINVVFPEYNNKDFADFTMFSKYYELFTCMYMITYMKENLEQFNGTDVLDSLINEFNKRLAILEFRAALGTYTFKSPIEPEIVFEPYELVNKVKSFITSATEYDEVNLTYTKNDYEHNHKELYLGFIANEPVPTNDEDLNRVRT